MTVRKKKLTGKERKQQAKAQKAEQLRVQKRRDKEEAQASEESKTNEEAVEMQRAVAALGTISI